MKQVGLALAAVDQYLKIHGRKAKQSLLLTSDPSSTKAGARAQAQKVRVKERRAAKALVVMAAPLLLMQPVERLGNGHKDLPGAPNFYRGHQLSWERSPVS